MNLPVMESYLFSFLIPPYIDFKSSIKHEWMNFIPHKMYFWSYFYE